MAFHQKENIGIVNTAMRAYGLKPEYIFVTNDLHDGSNMRGVQIGLQALGEKANTNGIKPQYMATKAKPQQDASWM